MKVDLVLQGKGGVGKSIVASFLSQFLKGRFDPVLCVDTDPVNATFFGYRRLAVERLAIMDGPDINSRAFDELVERVTAQSSPGARMVVDNGAASFVPFCSYLASCDVLGVLKETGHEVTLHTVLTGGQAFGDTFSGLVELLRHFENTPIVVWMNEFFGPLEQGGVRLESSSQYKAVAPRITAQITLPAVPADTFGVDVKRMLSERLTFDEALASDAYSVMARHRLKRYRDKVFGDLERAGL